MRPAKFTCIFFAVQWHLFQLISLAISEIAGGGLGPNLIVTGKTSFQADYSDRFTHINDPVIDDNIIRSDPLYGYDELGSLINLSSEYFVVFAIACVIIYFLSRYEIIPSRESTWFKI
jgi:hypothetical protein